MFLYKFKKFITKSKVYDSYSIHVELRISGVYVCRFHEEYECECCGRYAIDCIECGNFD